MKKIVLLTVVAITSFVTSSNAQEKGSFNLGIGPTVSLPVGKFNDTHTFGFGGEIQAAYGITDHIAGFAQIGYNHFIGQTTNLILTSVKQDDAGLVPVLAGARYQNSGFMAGIGIGYTAVTSGYIDGGFTFSPQIGYSFMDGKLDVLAHYTSIASDRRASMLGLKVFYNFLGGK